MDNVKNATEHMVCFFLKNIQKSNDFEFSVWLCFPTNILLSYIIYVLFMYYLICIIYVLLMYYLCTIFVLFVHYLLGDRLVCNSNLVCRHK